MQNVKDQENTCDLPEVLDFLNLSRNVIRQINLFKKTDMTKRHKQITVNAVVKLVEEALKYAEENVDDSL